MHRYERIFVGILAALTANVCLSPANELTQGTQFTAAQIEFFENHVRPVLVAHCYECHSTDAEELQAELYVDSRAGMITGGESGPAIVVGKPDQSPLISAVKYETNEMPPDRKLTDAQVAALVKWVEIGAPWPEVTSAPGRLLSETNEIDWDAARAGHWAWQAPVKPRVPTLAHDGESHDGESHDGESHDGQSHDGQSHNGETDDGERRGRDESADDLTTNPIDNFVVARRVQAGLKANGLAAPQVLVRRIYVDLIGIVPSPAEVQSFVTEAEQNRQLAVESLIDRLLQSPMYGQRWARHWLDVARYSDGLGGFLDNQALNDAWRYRDWVVDAFNRDMPIDQFLRLQIAGDILGDAHDAVATGFFALGPEYQSDGGDPDSIAQAKGETLDDRMDTLTRGLLGITGSCARCHDHKFDPIQQLDYYALAGVFNNTATRRMPLADQEAVDRVDQHQKSVKDLQIQIKKLQQALKNEQRHAADEERTRLAGWKQELESLQRNPPPGYATAHALMEAGDADMYVAVRGNLRKTGERAPRRFLRVLTRGEPARFSSGSGRRELAAAIVDPGNPLTVRVFVNRVWMHHFGQAIVRTPSNFGSLGQPPTHPLLLDWLADDFVEHGWSLKRLHRQIMMSATYQLSSSFDEQSFRRDAGNELLWRANPRRMDVEAWRDSLLAVAGELDASTGGPPVDDIGASSRRTLYAKVSRNGDVFRSDEFLRRFDFPLMRATVAKRPQSIVPQQYLFLLNSPFMVQRAKSLVARLDRFVDRSAIQRIESAAGHGSVSVAGQPSDRGAISDEQKSDEQKTVQAYWLLYGRSPRDDEWQLARDFLAQDSADQNGLTAWEQYAQALLSSNEFMFVR